MISSYFIGYFERSRGYKFYNFTLKTIFEIGIAWFFEDVEFGGGEIRLKTLPLRKNQSQFLNQFLQLLMTTSSFHIYCCLTSESGTLTR